MFDEKYDVVVIGAGHAGCEAALASARIGFKTLCLTMNLDSVALMACNPAIGGTAKGHLVREIDALGGEMGLAADDTFIQIKMLNTAKGPAVQSLRAQIDKKQYQRRMKHTLETTGNLYLKQGKVKNILEKGGKVCGIETDAGETVGCEAIVVASGVYLKSRIIIGSYRVDSGPSGLFRSDNLSDSLLALGFELQRFKTGTPARVHRASLDFHKMIPQYGDDPIVPFSFMTKDLKRPQVPCYLTYTNEMTHRIIRDNLHLAPMYNGTVDATGTRYCPSIEDKVVRFADKERHQLFIEPEGLDTEEMYVQGMSTGLPSKIQIQMLRTIQGLEKVEIMRPAYAIEYDCIYPSCLYLSLQSRHIQGLFFAGQINGTSGYEEAAAQGIVAGINAAMYLKGDEPLLIRRSQGYTGVLIDDLVTKGTKEPYRMMTSRAEYRLTLRQDNADFRLSEEGRRVGLLQNERYEAFCRRREQLEQERRYCADTVISQANTDSILQSKGQQYTGKAMRLKELLKHTGVSYEDIAALGYGGSTDSTVQKLIETEIKYEGYIKKQEHQVEQFVKMENKKFPTGTDYTQIHGLRLEARQKLNATAPENLGQASRISGVSPADVAVLAVWLKGKGQQHD
ncbi:MAG: tRNA uridine-5-carboxymethylaminomethyl(34) synthesis enzyme MnmG [Christensenellales bacterium]